MKRDWAGPRVTVIDTRWGRGLPAIRSGLGGLTLIGPGGIWTEEVRGLRPGQERALRRPGIGA